MGISKATQRITTQTHHFRLVSFLQVLLTLDFGQLFESLVQKLIVNWLGVDHWGPDKLDPPNSCTFNVTAHHLTMAEVGQPGLDEIILR